MDNEWFPTQHGTYRAYAPEYLDGEKWRSIEVVKNKYGIPQPLMHGGVNETIGLFGHAQAMALAWEYAAIMAAQKYTEVSVKVQEYEVVYDIKARKIAPAGDREGGE